MQDIRKFQSCTRRNIWQFRYFEVSGYLSLYGFIMFYFSKKAGAKQQVCPPDIFYLRSFPQNHNKYGIKMEKSVSGMQDGHRYGFYFCSDREDTYMYISFFKRLAGLVRNYDTV